MKRLISIVGTTGIGKTKLAIDLATQLSTEIISCDSRQFFKDMEIGTAAPTSEELAAAPHHFIGHLNVQDYYSIGQFEEDGINKISELFQTHDNVIMVGGSMMYEKAIIEGLHDLPEANSENQEKLNQLWHTEGYESIQKLMEDLDPDYYSIVDKDNPRRLLRAVDVIWQTGEKYSDLIAKPKPKRDFSVIRIGIQAPREIIYDRINKRVEKMMAKGLLDEVKALDDIRKSSNEILPSLNTVGYTELFKYLDEIWDLDFAVSEIQKNSRRFAKRQLTWYRGESDIHWVSHENPLEEALQILQNH